MLDIDYLRECISYDEKTGRFIWLVRPAHHFKTALSAKRVNATTAGKPAFYTMHSAGYLIGSINRRFIYAHRAAWAVYYGAWPNNEIDHINHDKKDNRIVNLREVDRTENGRNISMKSNNRSGFTGVHVQKESGLFVAQIRVSNKTIHLGSFRDIELAKSARLDAEIKYGFHRNHGL